MNSTQDFFILLQANITFIMMKKQYVKAETEIVPMKTESFMAGSPGASGTASNPEAADPDNSDPDPEFPARAHNDDMEYSFEPTPLSQQKKNKE